MANLIWNYECFRDFCPSFSNWKDENDELLRHNKALLYFLPEAINAIDPEFREQLISDNEELYIDYSTGINIKSVICDSLLNNHQVTSEELAAILDVVYVEMLPVEVEMTANKLIKKAEAEKNTASVIAVQPGSLAEFALKSGCDYMDMTTMTTYRSI